MQYQLPNGKVIYLSVEEYLNLSDAELYSIVHSGYAQDNPNFTSYARGRAAPKKEVEDNQYEDNGLDYKPESDETDTSGPVNLNDID